jgi:hypothetical protein
MNVCACMHVCIGGMTLPDSLYHQLVAAHRAPTPANDPYTERTWLQRAVSSSAATSSSSTSLDGRSLVHCWSAVPRGAPVRVPSYQRLVGSARRLTSGILHPRIARHSTLSDSVYAHRVCLCVCMYVSMYMS